MNFRKIVISLTATLLLLIIGFAVLMGGYAVCVTAKDEEGAKILWWVAMFDLIGFIIDLILLVCFLGAAYIFPTDKSQIENPNVE